VIEAGGFNPWDPENARIVADSMAGTLGIETEEGAFSLYLLLIENTLFRQAWSQAEAERQSMTMLALYSMAPGVLSNGPMWETEETRAGYTMSGESLPILEYDLQKMPRSAAGIRQAQAAGAPSILTRTTDKQQIKNNRALATSGFSGSGSPDEYPFASTMEGGTGAHVTGVPLAEQRIQGGTLSSFYRQNGIGHGGRFIVIVQ
jgi:hypothetical protein